MRALADWLVCDVVLATLVGLCTAVTVSPCGSDKTAEVVQGRGDNLFLCSGMSPGETVSWRCLYQTSDFTAGSCPGNGGACSGGSLGVAFTTTRVSSTSIRLTINSTQINNDVVIREGVLKCATVNSEDSCQVDYIVPAQGICRTEQGAESERFLLKGSCRLQDGTISSRGRYRCEWYINRQDSTESLILNKTLSSTNFHTDCLLNQSIPTLTGHFTYTVKLIPGRTVVNAGNITVVRPSAPSISCSPAGFVPVNTAVLCTCTTNNTGQPQGRLKGVKVTGGSIIDVATYGASTLQLSPVTLTARDHNVTILRCDVEWVEDIAGAVYTPQVGLPPSTTTFRLNNQASDQVVYESQNVTFDCHTSNGRPPPTITLTKQATKADLHQDSAPLTYTLSARCEDSGVYVCTADNEMGPASASVPRQLTVQCTPRGTQDLGEVNFTGNPTSVSFDITAYPVPHQVTFAYLGLCECQAGTPRVVKGITLTGDCRAKPGVVYMSACTVTVSRAATVSATGVYRVDVANQVGNASFQLFVRVEQTTPEGPASSDSSYLGLAVGFGVLSAVLILLITAVLLWLWRRQWLLPCAGHQDRHTSPSSEPSKRESSADDVYLEPIATSSDSLGTRGPYDILNTADIGQRSTYSEINQRTERGTAGPYDTLDLSEIGQRSDYSEISQRRRESAAATGSRMSALDEVEDIGTGYKNV